MVFEINLGPVRLYPYLFAICRWPLRQATANPTRMTGRQLFLRTAYPLLMQLSKLFGSNRTVLHNTRNAPPAQPFHLLEATLSNGEPFPFSSLENKKVLLVNTASDCGYTAQYAALQQLQEQFPELLVLAFPANDFKEQEKGSDAAIAQFCRQQYGIRFPLMQKSSVVKGPQQNSVYRWLSDAAQNGWNNHAPEWNFGKYLVNKKGQLMHYFGPAVSPLSKRFLQAVHQL